MSAKFIVVRIPDCKFATHGGWSDEYPNAMLLPRAAAIAMAKKTNAMVYSTDGYEQGTGPVYRSPTVAEVRI